MRTAASPQDSMASGFDRRPWATAGLAYQQGAHRRPPDPQLGYLHNNDGEDWQEDLADIPGPLIFPARYRLGSR